MPVLLWSKKNTFIFKTTNIYLQNTSFQVLLYQCPFCVNLFPSQAILTQHITANHASNLNSNGTTPAVAAAAANTQQQQQQQQQIILNLNNAADAASYSHSGKTPLGVLFQCDQCQDIFSDKSLLEYHTIEAHSKFLANGENSDLIRTAMAVTNGTASEQTKSNDKNSSIFVMLGGGSGGGTETLYS